MIKRLGLSCSAEAILGDGRHRFRDSKDSGETLVEVLAAVVLLGGALLVLMAGLGSVIALGHVRQQQAAVNAVTRSIADSLSVFKTTDCANYASLASAVTGAARPAGVTVTLLTITQGRYAPATRALTFPVSNVCTASSTPTPSDTGTVQIKYTVAGATASASGSGAGAAYVQTVAVVLGSPRG